MDAFEVLHLMMSDEDSYADADWINLTAMFADRLAAVSSKLTLDEIVSLAEVGKAIYQRELMDFTAHSELRFSPAKVG